jgi:hypothetical protein
MTDSDVLKIKAIFFSLLAGIAGVAFLWLPWAPRIDFDITGIMFALGNMPRAAALVAFLAWGGIAATFWMRFRRS